MLPLILKTTILYLQVSILGTFETINMTYILFTMFPAINKLTATIKNFVSLKPIRFHFNYLLKTLYYYYYYEFDFVLRRNGFVTSVIRLRFIIRPINKHSLYNK